MPRVRDLYREQHDKVDFLLVYTLEAHPDDEWPICNGQHTPDGAAVHVEQPRKIEDRLALAAKFTKEYEVPFTVLVDNMENDFEGAFASWPTRIHMVQRSKLMFKKMPEGDDGAQFTLATLEAALEEFFETQ